MKLLKSEGMALAALLEQGAETPLQLAEAFTRELDRLRGERGLLYYACFEYAGIPGVVGPFSTRKQAETAMGEMPCDNAWVIPGRTAEGHAAHLAAMAEPPAPFKLSAQEERKRTSMFWAAVSRVREKEVTAITGNVTVRAVKIP